ncbi:protein kinase domain-containing protein [Ditylenchus destructor]|nr:protein kinase domain-containing protein [Ditylenchus destructor]
MACDNPFVVKMYDFIEDNNYVYLVFESVENGLLRQTLESRFSHPSGGIPEDFVLFYVAQVYLALNHMHSKGYTHNDLWIDNCLLDKQGFLKLIDFGLSFKLDDFKDSEVRERYIGKENSWPFRGWYYNRAPERIKAEEYAPSADYWQLGLLTYRLAFGMEAFTAIAHEENETEEEKWSRDMKEKSILLNGKYTIPESPTISENMKDFIGSLLTVDPKHRLGHTNPEDIKHHKWFTSVNFEWEALERKDVNHFHKYLHESKEADNDQMIPSVTLDEKQIPLSEANAAEMPPNDTAGGPNSMVEDIDICYYHYLII